MFKKKYVKFDLDAMEDAIKDLETAIDDLDTIQKNLQKAVDALVDSKGWDSDAGSAFTDKYNNTWGEGIKDRRAIMERMLEHLEFALEKYGEVVEEAEALTLTID